VFRNEGEEMPGARGSAASWTVASARQGKDSETGAARLLSCLASLEFHPLSINLD
jgi:hypothetical protein